MAIKRSSISTKEIADNTFIININKHVYSYLLIGSHEALLVDTGWGTVDLKKEVLKHTSLPLKVIQTHGHLDHIMGGFQFEEIFIRNEDHFFFDIDYTPEKRQNLIDNFGSDLLPESMSEADWVNKEHGKLVNCSDIEQIDLGNRVIEIIHTPGHTHGSICLLDKSRRILISGDSVLAGSIMLHFSSSGTLHDYQNSLLKIMNYTESFDQILPAHGKSPIENHMLTSTLELCRDIIAGKEQGKEWEIFGKKCLSSARGHIRLTWPNR